jgi:hypothetical protein
LLDADAATQTVSLLLDAEAATKTSSHLPNADDALHASSNLPGDSASQPASHLLDADAFAEHSFDLQVKDAAAHTSPDLPILDIASYADASLNLLGTIASPASNLPVPDGESHLSSCLSDTGIDAVLNSVGLPDPEDAAQLPLSLLELSVHIPKTSPAAASQFFSAPSVLQPSLVMQTTTSQPSLTSSVDASNIPAALPSCTPTGNFVSSSSAAPQTSLTSMPPISQFSSFTPSETPRSVGPKVTAPFMLSASSAADIYSMPSCPAAATSCSPRSTPLHSLDFQSFDSQTVSASTAAVPHVSTVSKSASLSRRALPARDVNVEKPYDAKSSAIPFGKNDDTNLNAHRKICDDEDCNNSLDGFSISPSCSEDLSDNEAENCQLPVQRKLAKKDAVSCAIVGSVTAFGVSNRHR